MMRQTHAEFIEAMIFAKHETSTEEKQNYAPLIMKNEFVMRDACDANISRFPLKSESLEMPLKQSFRALACLKSQHYHPTLTSHLSASAERKYSSQISP